MLPKILPVVVLVGCASANHPPAKTPPSAPADTAPVVVEPSSPDGEGGQSARAPITVTLTEQKRGPTSAVVVARITRIGVTRLGLRATVTAPPGVQVTGETSFLVDPSDAPLSVEKTYDLQFSKQPQEDLVLVVDGADASVGFHAEVHYRFGRPEPVVPPPNTNGPEINLGGHNLGHTVDMTSGK